MSEQYYSISQVSERLGVTYNAVYSWVKTGKIKAVKAGRTTRIPESALQEFLQPVEVKAKKGE